MFVILPLVFSVHSAIDYYKSRILIGFSTMDFRVYTKTIRQLGKQQTKYSSECILKQLDNLTSFSNC